MPIHLLTGVYEPGIALLVIAVCVFLMQILYSHHITTIFTVQIIQCIILGVKSGSAIRIFNPV